MADECDLALVGGRVVTPGGVVDGGVAVRDGRIAAIGGARDLPPARRTIDLRGRVLLPGVIDPECHLGGHRSLADDVESETRAAAATGVTTWGQQAGGAQPAYNFDDGTVYAACEAIAALGPPALVLFHCENWQIARVLQQRLQAAGRTDMGAWDDHSPWFTEAAHARAYLYFVELTGCPAYVVHCTTEQTVAEIQRVRQAGATVYAQIGIHYLVLHKDAWRINVP